MTLFMGQIYRSLTNLKTTNKGCPTLSSMFSRVATSGNIFPQEHGLNISINKRRYKFLQSHFKIIALPNSNLANLSIFSQDSFHQQYFNLAKILFLLHPTFQKKAWPNYQNPIYVILAISNNNCNQIKPDFNFFNPLQLLMPITKPCLKLISQYVGHFLGHVLSFLPINLLLKENKSIVEKIHINTQYPYL